MQSEWDSGGLDGKVCFPPFPRSSTSGLLACQLPERRQVAQGRHRQRMRDSLLGRILRARAVRPDNTGYLGVACVGEPWSECLRRRSGKLHPALFDWREPGLATQCSAFQGKRQLWPSDADHRPSRTPWPTRGAFTASRRHRYNTTGICRAHRATGKPVGDDLGASGRA